MGHNIKTIVAQFFILYYICMIKLLKNWLPVILWAGLIFYLSAQPSLKSDYPWPYDFILRKGAHIVEFAILFMLLLRAFGKYNFFTKKALFWAFCLVILYAFSDEFHQSFVAQRVASLADVAIDSFGVLLVTWWRIRRFS
jgi:VanZ family protein